MNTAILKYFNNTGTDDKGRTLEETLLWDDNKMEVTHDFIQWWFPLFEPSNYNSSAPLLDLETQMEFLKSIKMQGNLLHAFNRFHQFLFNDQFHRIEMRNHNWLRITRVLHSLRLLGLSTQAKKFFQELKAPAKKDDTTIAASTFLYWADAAGEKI